MRFSKAMSLGAIGMLIGCPSLAYADTLKVDKFPCEVIKGKTYISWISGTFDGSESVLSSKVIFDSNGSGSTYEFFRSNPTSTSASILKRNITCVATPVGVVSVDGSPVGKWSLLYPEGIVFFTSYNNGSKVWLNFASQKDRVNKGWMLQLPPKS